MLSAVAGLIRLPIISRDEYEVCLSPVVMRHALNHNAFKRANTMTAFFTTIIIIKT